MAAAAAAAEPALPIQEEQPSGQQNQPQEEEKQSDEGQNGKASPQSQGLDPPEDPLRNAPTFKDELAPEREQEGAPPETPKSPGFVEKTMQKLGLNDVLLKCMFKGSVAPVIGLAIYQAEPVMRILTTLGYLVGVITVLALAVLPRGKFIQNMILNCLSTAVGCAMAMLISYTGVKARLNTSDLREMAAFIQANGRAPYNSSQSAVCGVWLFFQIWLSNVIRAKYPAFNVPVIIYSIVVNISCTFGPEFPTLATAEAFIQRLVTAIFMGLAIATGVSLIVFPISSRQVVAKQMAGVLGLFKKSVVLEKEYLQGLEKEDMFALEITETSAGRSEPERKAGKKDKGPKLTKEQKNAMALKGTIGAIRELMGKIYGDMKFAKRDIAWGHLSAKDFGEMFNLIRMCVIPMTGIGTIMDIFQRVGRERGWDNNGPGDDGGVFQRFEPIGKEESQRIWNDIMKQLHEPFEILSEAITQGIDHAGILLKLFPQPKAQKKAAAQHAGGDADVEASGGELRPGQVGFSSVISEKIEVFNSRKGEILRLWAKDKGLCSDGNFENWAKDSTRLFEKRRNDQAQLYVILYLEKLMQATGEAVQDLVAFAEAKVEDGTMTKKRLIFPNGRRLRKWFLGIFSNEDSTAEDSPDIMETGTNVVYLGQGWMNKKDPEHLPARNAWERFGNGVRRFSHFFGSPESVFGFRVACATMTIGIIAFLESSQRFFIQQRLVWAMIIIAIGMTQTSGQSTFGFLCRVGGTFIAMVNCFIIYYIVDYKIPGIFVFLWLFIFIEYYFFFKYPQFIPAAMICIVTQVLILGYELQTNLLGVTASESSGQPYYPLYELAPYRLATVAAGAFVAFFWTVFPSPFTDRTWLRKDLSAVLYLLANYSSVVHTTMKATMSGTVGDMEIPGTPAHSLFKVRRKLFGKLTLLLPSLQMHANFQKFEPSLGGKFPEEQYQDIILRSTRIMNYCTLMSYVLTYLAPKGPEENSDKDWMHVLGEVFEDVSPVHNQILSTLTLLSNSLLSGQSLPPYLPLPKPYEMTRHLLSMPAENPKSHHKSSTKAAQHSSSSASSASSSSSTSTHSHQRPATGEPSSQPASSTSQHDEYKPSLEPWSLLDARNMEQKGYTEFAVLQVCSTLIIGDLEGLIATVAELVGTVDFSFRVEHSDDSSVSDLGSVRRVGTWASRAAEARAASLASGGQGTGERGKGKRD
ncbi:hypothetical protein N8I77_008416 [Diaporthe amygdali]|uniref:ER transporter 6TM N-terminal domain-containing protein n=1 Tax=Phomopsis amygdali TaxID=1214568 RepID=A0AAD9W578_PHOAM|nr:hypothetical protein N8I77_008416 [Diaporthe amygdali]